MSDNSIYILMVVARVLKRLPQPVVYTGGATIPLYLDALSARDMRPTDDVDCVVEVTSQREYYQLSATLRELGLSEDSSPGTSVSMAVRRRKTRCDAHRSSNSGIWQSLV